MEALDYATRAAMSRPRSIGLGCFGLLCAALIASFPIAQLDELRADLGYLHHRTAEARSAHWAWLTCSASLIAVLCALTIWLIARSLRAALALPPRPRTRFGRLFFVLRLAGGLCLWFKLWSDGLSEYNMYGSTHAPTQKLGLGLAMCLLFAYDVPRLFRNAASALAARWPMLRARFVELDRLPPRGRVHVRGRLVGAVAPLASQSLQIEGPGGTATVELDPARLVIIAELPARADDGRDSTLPSGTEVRVIGSLRDEGGIYRSIRRIDAGDDKLHLYVGPATLTRRLLVAALVELLAALGLSACVLGTIAFWLYVAYLVR